MVQFKIEKKDLMEAATLMVQVANTGSKGASPAENSSIYLFQNSISLMNNSAVNGLLIENIPMTVKEGDNISEHFDKEYRINTKKMASIIKSCKKMITFTIDDTTVTMGEGKRKYDLAIHSTSKEAFPDIRLLDYKINIEDTVKNLKDAGLITERVDTLEDLSGTLFTGNDIIASDKVSAIYIKEAGLFKGAAEMDDIVVDTDLFSACLSKTSEKEAIPGFTTDGQRLVLKFGNNTLYKTMLSSNFPKTTLINKINSTINEKESSVKAVIPLKEFMEKLKEIRNIVESDEYLLTYNGKEGSLTINNNNEKIGTQGKVSMDVEITLPENSSNTVCANFTYTHLEMFGKIFEGSETIEVFSSMVTQGDLIVLRYLAVLDGHKLFFCTPRL